MYRSRLRLEPPWVEGAQVGDEAWHEEQRQQAREGGDEGEGRQVGKLRRLHAAEEAEKADAEAAAHHAARSG